MRLRPEHAQLARKLLFPVSIALTALGVGIVAGVGFATRAELAAPIVLEPAFTLADPASSITPPTLILETPEAVAAATPELRDEPEIVATPNEVTPAVAVEVPAAIVEARSRAAVLGGNPAATQERDEALKQWAAIAPKEALRWLSFWRDGRARAEGTALLASVWIPNDAAGAIAALAHVRDFPIHEPFESAVAERLCRALPDKAVELSSRAFDSRVRASLLPRVVENLAGAAPAQAVSSVQQLPEGATRTEMLALALSIWSRADSTAAAVATIGMNDALERARTLDELLRGWAGGNVDDVRAVPSGFVAKLLEHAARSSRRTTRDEAAGAVLTAVARVDFARAVSLLDELPQGLVRAEVAAQLISRSAVTNPEAAAQLAASLPAGASRVKALRPVASVFARDDQSRALEWLETIPDEAGRSAATQAVMFDAQDLAGIERWIESMSEPSKRDRAVQAYVVRLARDDPARGATWATRIEDTALRHYAIEFVARAWQRTDPAAVEGWLPGTDLPAQSRERVLSASERGEG